MNVNLVGRNRAHVETLAAVGDAPAFHLEDAEGFTAARRVVIFAAGRSKAGAVLAALSDEESELPAALALMGEGAATVLLDPAAASHWSRPPR